MVDSASKFTMESVVWHQTSLSSKITTVTWARVFIKGCPSDTTAVELSTVMQFGQVPSQDIVPAKTLSAFMAYVKLKLARL
jgi:hypothetical protein